MESSRLNPQEGSLCGHSLSPAVGGWGKSLCEWCPGLLCHNPSQVPALPAPVEPRATQCSASLVSQHPPCTEAILCGPGAEWDPLVGLRVVKSKGLSAWSCWQGPCC